VPTASTASRLALPAIPSCAGITSSGTTWLPLAAIWSSGRRRWSRWGSRSWCGSNCRRSRRRGGRGRRCGLRLWGLCRRPRRRCRSSGNLEIDAGDESLWGLCGTADCPRGPTSGEVLLFLEGLRLPSTDVVEVVAGVSYFPQPAAHRLVRRTCEGRRHTIRSGAPSSSGPSVHCWIARQVTSGAIALRPIQERPIRRIADLTPACDLEPRLAAMLDSHGWSDPQVRAWSQHRNAEPCRIIPLLPELKPSVHFGQI